MIFRQLFHKESSTLTYLLADEKSSEALIIDPVLECFERDTKLIEELGLKLKYTLETHIHADHITSAYKFKQHREAQIAVGSETGHKSADILLEDGQTIHFGSYELLSIHTPGHTNGCVTFFCENMLFTGDTLFIRGCGRTDFQSGSSEDLYHSVMTKLYSYPSSTKVYPGHDYNGRLSSTVGEEKLHNPRLKEIQSLEGFNTIMASLNLPKPAKIKEALPANLKGGAT